ncbi:hypothetical protein ACP8HZ_05690 [Francisella noatunensis]
MDNTVDKDFKDLFENISIYYDQERSFRINKIDECIDNIIKFQDKN